MELANIEKLLQKYLNAETTIQEEAMLQTYFTSNNVAPQLQEYVPLFSYFKSNKSETYTKTIQLNSKKANWKWLSIAASFVLIVSIYTGKQYNDKQQAKLAFSQTQEALQMISKQLDKGNLAIANLQEYERAKNTIFKSEK